MNCQGCGAVIAEGATACAACGRPVMVPPPPSGPSRLTTPIRKVAGSTVEVTKSAASEIKKTGKAALGEAKLAVRDVGTLTRKAVNEVGKGLEDLGKELQKTGKKQK